MAFTLHVLVSPVYQFTALFSHLITLLVLSGIHAIPQDTATTLGVSRTTLVLYSAVLVLLFALGSYFWNWSWPLEIEITFFIIFLWVIYGELAGATCVCCTATTPETPSFVAQLCIGDSFENVYSSLWLLVFLSSYVIDSHSTVVYVLSIIMMIFGVILVVVPNLCNTLPNMTFNLILIRVTLFGIIWIINRYYRLYEGFLRRAYLHVIRAVAPSVPLRNIRATVMFERLSLVVSGDPRTDYLPPGGGYTLAGSTISWKNVAYEPRMIYPIDFLRTAWIMFVCPLYLIAAAVPIAWMLWGIYVSGRELYNLEHNQTLSPSTTTTSKSIAHPRKRWIRKL